MTIEVINQQERSNLKRVATSQIFQDGCPPLHKRLSSRCDWSRTGVRFRRPGFMLSRRAQKCRGGAAQRTPRRRTPFPWRKTGGARISHPSFHDAPHVVGGFPRAQALRSILLLQELSNPLLQTDHYPRRRPPSPVCPLRFLARKARLRPERR